jgi:hypothetical protein
MNTRGVQDLLAFYFQHIGMRRRGIGLLNHLGVCSSYDRVAKIQAPLVDHALVGE